jgi:hypothetical protein
MRIEGKIKDWEDGTYSHECLGCKGHHKVPTTKESSRNGHIWTFNGDFNKPTFSPSVNNSWGEPPFKRCHYVITNGMIAYCDDCTHSFKGQTIELPNYTE